ncbi:MAG TPA: hypothetical protein PLR25_27495, partial [Planctomycetaceae bacterium]|nr:hypothetical protein [Planctomycetaceae bacterium]
VFRQRRFVATLAILPHQPTGPAIYADWHSDSISTEQIQPVFARGAEETELPGISRRRGNPT